MFKGGTSLSKCHHVINRFSEDIDISFSDKLTEGKRKKLKNEVISNISTELELPIIDWDKARSKRDYNCYTFSYEPLEGFISDSLRSGVKMETALGVISYPTISLPVGNYVYEYLKKENMDLVEAYDLAPFEMRLQSLERTLVDKVFAICDYYLFENDYAKNNPGVDLDELSDILTKLKAIANCQIGVIELDAIMNELFNSENGRIRL